MKRQIEMEELMLRAHREFMQHLCKSLDLLDKDIEEAREMEHLCTDEWCLATEDVLDELAKIIFSISEPRWLPETESKKIRSLRRRIHDLYSRYKAVKK